MPPYTSWLTSSRQAPVIVRVILFRTWSARTSMRASWPRAAVHPWTRRRAAAARRRLLTRGVLFQRLPVEGAGGAELLLGQQELPPLHEVVPERLEVPREPLLGLLGVLAERPSPQRGLGLQLLLDLRDEREDRILRVH